MSCPARHAASALKHLRLAGHDETEKSTKQGKPIARMMKMAQAMLEAVHTFKMPGSALRIRLGGPSAAAASSGDPASFINTASLIVKMYLKVTNLLHHVLLTCKTGHCFNESKLPVILLA